MNCYGMDKETSGKSLENAHLNAGHVLGEPLVLFRDLESQLPRVTHDQDRHLSINWLKLLEGGQHKDGSLTHT